MFILLYRQRQKSKENTNCIIDKYIFRIILNIKSILSIFMNTKTFSENLDYTSKSTYSTGLESYTSEGQLCIDQSIQNIQDAMYQRNPVKYGDFLGILKSQSLLLRLMNVPQRKERLELFRHMYYALRLLDDICDGDLVDKLSDEKVRGILEGKEFWLYETLKKEAISFAITVKIEADIQVAFENIEKSLGFDYMRSQEKSKYRNRHDLRQNFDLMDIIGTIIGTALILGVDPETAQQKFWPLWDACRIAYNIQDIVDDMHVGLINIPLEDMQKFWINDDDIEMMKKMPKTQIPYTIKKLQEANTPESILAWIYHESQKMQTLITDFKTRYSVTQILSWDLIPSLYPQNPLRARFNNLLMRLLVAERVYIIDTEKVLS